jgi:hypothetical protein
MVDAGDYLPQVACNDDMETPHLPLRPKINLEMSQTIKRRT